MNKTLMIICMSLMVGCVTHKGPQYIYPDDLKNICQSERINARNCIESKGTKIYERSNKVELIKVDGTRKFGNEGWGWQSPECKGAWVLGLTYYRGPGNYLIKVGCNPKTKQEVQSSTVRHEYGHYWTMSNGDTSDHNPLYKDCFEGWRGMNVKSMTIRNGDEFIIIDYITDDLQ